MAEKSIELYQILSQRVEHFEKIMIAIVVALITLTTLILGDNFIHLNSDIELIILYIPFAILASLNYSLILRLLELVRSLKYIEEMDPNFKNFNITYYSKPSWERNVTFIFINAQVQFAFLFVPLLIHGDGLVWGYNVIMVVSISIFVIFTYSLIKKMRGLVKSS